MREGHCVSQQRPSFAGLTRDSEIIVTYKNLTLTVALLYASFVLKLRLKEQLLFGTYVS